MPNIAIMATSGGSGKDTIADYIMRELSDEQHIKKSLGQPIHELAEEFATGHVERHHLQDLGESMRSIFGENTWINKLDKSLNDEEPVIIPDIRKLLEFSHYVVEKNYFPLYIKVDSEVAKNRLMKRDGGYNQEDLKRNIEKQMNFIESLPTKAIEDGHGLEKVTNSGVFNNIYIINNSGSFDKTKKQLKKWWELIG